jgi:DNA-binding transcriptional ArsR family regulator
MATTSLDRPTASASPMADNVGEVTEILKLLSAPARLLALCHLVDGEKSVGALSELTGSKPTTLSQHLALLRAHGLVTTRREGTTIYYTLASQEIAGLIAYLHKAWCTD